MDPESRKLLENTFQLAKENNRMLHKIRSVQKRAALWSFLRLLLIIGISVGAFYYIQPYTDKIANVYKVIQLDLNTIKAVTGVK